MINFHEVAGYNSQERHLFWLQIPDYQYRILIVGSTRSGKTNALLNLINHQPNIDKIFLFAKNL